MTASPEVSTALAACHDVELVYGDGDAEVTALAGVSIEIGYGERVGLLGRSGSGKTTLLHVLGGLAEPTEGHVEWQGQPLASLDRVARAARAQDRKSVV